MKTSTIRTGIVAFLCCAVTAILACSNRPTDPSPSAVAHPAAQENTGTGTYELRLGRTTHINKANYTITCSGGFTQSGTIDVSKLRDLEGSIPNLPADATCSVTVTASSTNGNVQCSGSASGLVVTCPQDQQDIKLTCTRNHVGREWGDDDWKENARTFFLGVELNLVCCVPQTTCPNGANCGTIPNGCGGTVTCGTCAAPTICVIPQGDTAGVCEAQNCVPTTCAALGRNCGTTSDGCGGTLNCGTCSTPPATACRECPPGTGTAASCGCVPINNCGSSTCGTSFDGCGCTISCGACTGGTCVIPEGGTAGTCTNCAPQCSGKQCGPDGCGGTCGTCASGQVCTAGTNPGQCCTEQATSVTCAGKNCGSVVDNCGVQVDCGTCASGTTCSSTDVCVDAGACVPRTTCPSGLTCGTAPDGCGGTVQCGTCSAGQVCDAGSCCTPQQPATACGARVCGVVSDGCGGEIQCGMCLGTESCGADGACHTGCDVGSTSLACLQTRDKSATIGTATQCSVCAQSNGCFDPTLQGGTCEMVTGNANPLSGTLPDGQTCAQVIGAAPVSEIAVCFETLRNVFGSGCAVSLQMTPCLCGTTDPTQCTAGAVTPNGPLYDLYACDFGSASGSTINAIATDFAVQTFGAGMGNSIIACAGAFGCDCF